MTDATLSTVALSGRLSIRDAAGILQQLEAGLATSAGMTIDCAALTGADISIVQLLVAARRSAADAGKTVRLEAPPGGALHTLLQQAGVIGADGEPLVADGDFWASMSSEAA